ncbi:uncharacterized protein LOC120356631 [Nilaparvata lugens]|uniref:uncharacterized protein LOC120356631 n=1 Tax=Nilaparvata lugens TaxID=108931 RepID=UPI00193C95C3|nr:uncharacterized protein LOC120356631 [Nilaparvata lugens]
MKWLILNSAIVAFYLCTTSVVEVNTKKPYKIKILELNGTQISNSIGTDDDLLREIISSGDWLLNFDLKSLSKMVATFHDWLPDALDFYLKAHALFLKVITFTFAFAQFLSVKSNK